MNRKNVLFGVAAVSLCTGMGWGVQSGTASEKVRQDGEQGFVSSLSRPELAAAAIPTPPASKPIPADVIEAPYVIKALTKAEWAHFRSLADAAIHHGSQEASFNVSEKYGYTFAGCRDSNNVLHLKAGIDLSEKMCGKQHANNFTATVEVDKDAKIHLDHIRLDLGLSYGPKFNIWDGFIQYQGIDPRLLLRENQDQLRRYIDFWMSVTPEDIAKLPRPE